jgi:ribosomal-protein-alanine N-acetyltransferase
MKIEFPIILNTSRLILRPPTESDAVAFQAFEDRNSQRLSPWRPSIAQWAKELEEKRAIRFALFPKENPAQIIGFCNFSQIFRGPFQACYLGYQMDANYEGLGLMTEAVEKGIQYMFEEENLHRIMANYMPSNKKSARILQKLGFIIEGEAKKYLLINGEWEDHILTSLTNQNWTP